MSDNEAHRRIWNDPDVRLELVSASEEPLYCEACGKLMTREDLRESPCPTLCIDCCASIDRDYEAQRDDEPWPGWFEEA